MIECEQRHLSLTAKVTLTALLIAFAWRVPKIHQLVSARQVSPTNTSRRFLKARRSFLPKRLLSCLMAVASTELSRRELYPPEVTGSMTRTVPAARKASLAI